MCWHSTDEGNNRFSVLTLSRKTEKNSYWRPKGQYTKTTKSQNMFLFISLSDLLCLLPNYDKVVKIYIKWKRNIPSPCFLVLSTLLIVVDGFVAWVLLSPFVVAFSLNYLRLVLVPIVASLPIQFHVLLSAYLNRSIRWHVD